MKKIILYPILIIFSLLLLLVVTLSSVLFFRPELILNPKSLNFVLEKTHVLKHWSWKEAQMNFDWNKWNDRNLRGKFVDLCLDYESKSFSFKTCLEEVSWNYNVTFDFKEGLHAKTLEPIRLYSKQTKVVLIETTAKKEPSAPPNIWRYWKILWSPVMPDLDFNFQKIEIFSKNKPTIFDLRLRKVQKELTADALGFKLSANPKNLELLGPLHYRLPYELIKGQPLHLNNVKLEAKMKESGIPFKITGAIEVIDVLLTGKLDLPIKDSFSSIRFQKKLFDSLKAKIVLQDIQKNFSKYAPDKYPKLPAPLNVMEGSIVTTIEPLREKNGNLVRFASSTKFDLKSKKQILDLDVNTKIPLNLTDYSPGIIEVAMALNKVTLELPKISKKSRPPQFLPDSRIKNAPFGPKSESQTKEVEKEINLNFHLQALNEKALHLKTNLIKDELRFNFDLSIVKSNLEQGFIKLLPLKTILFKRPIQVKAMQLNFNRPREPLLEGVVIFPLPEYKITLKLEGPISRPRHSFSSEPPLGLHDIYAVLLFGKPMDELSPDDKTGAQKTNQILSQGILSLGVLYFLAGSPVEYVGYDPDSKKATAQIGLGKKTSLRVGRGRGGEGGNSTGFRISLGSGWYFDTSAQDYTTTTGTTTKGYGILLERIIAY